MNFKVDYGSILVGVSFISEWKQPSRLYIFLIRREKRRAVCHRRIWSKERVPGWQKGAIGRECHVPCIRMRSARAAKFFPAPPNETLEACKLPGVLFSIYLRHLRSWYWIIISVYFGLIFYAPEKKTNKLLADGANDTQACINYFTFVV